MIVLFVGSDKKSAFAKKMERVAIVGHTGFVGGYLKILYPHASCFRSTNIHEIANQRFDLLLIAGVSAKKWIANSEPQKDKQQIDQLLEALKSGVCAKKCILISTIDVYCLDSSETQDEDHIFPQTNEAYGKHRYELERAICEVFENTTIVRLSGLFGFGLKKNVIYDFLHHQPATLYVGSQFQWYDMQWFLPDLRYILSHHTATRSINLFPEPIPNEELFSILQDRMESKTLVLLPRDTSVKYDIRTKYGQNGTCYWRSKKACIISLVRYVSHMINNEIIVSNLCMKPLPMELLCDYGVTQQEIAPYHTFGRNFIDFPLSFYEQCTLRPYSMQSLFYPNNWKLDRDFDMILVYMRKLIDIAHILGVSILVFGSPMLRSCGETSTFHMTQLLASLDSYIGKRSMTICLEPNAKYYKCSFLTTCKETHEFVETLNLPHVSWMFDVGNMVLEQEDIKQCIQLYAREISHVHFSTTDLKSLHQSTVSFPWIRYELTKNGYAGKITLEMLHVSPLELRMSLHETTRTLQIDVAGCGFYGGHIAHVALENGYIVNVFEKDDVFSNVSSTNQNRVHLGFHYPRSFQTRQLCKYNYGRFLKMYPSFVSFIQNNLYFISYESCLDLDTYMQIMRAEELEFEVVHNEWLQKVSFRCLRVQEGVLDVDIAKTFFKKVLERVLSYKTYDLLQPPKDADLILDCTYNSFGTIVNAQFEPSLFLLYRKRDMQKEIAFTVMDGAFWSLYPFDLKKGLYSITHVKFGRISSYEATEQDIKNLENDVLTYYPTLLRDFEYVRCIVAKKHVMKSACASREMQLHLKDNVISVACGKITGLFDFEDFLDL
jgi:sugar phosphate isomerase/epimerase